MLKKLLIFFIVVFTVIVILLFIELSYNKKRAVMVFALPDDIVVLKNVDDEPIVIYNTNEVKRTEAFKKIPKTKRKNYKSVSLDEHVAKKITKPFTNMISDSKENFAETMPVSFVYNSAMDIVNLTRDITNGRNEQSDYKMLISTKSKRNAFIDDNNIYIV